MYSQVHADFESKPLVGRLCTTHPTFARMNQYVDMSSKEGIDHEICTSVERERERERERGEGEERMREKRFIQIYIFIMERERKLNKIIAKNYST